VISHRAESATQCLRQQPHFRRDNADSGSRELRQLRRGYLHRCPFGKQAGRLPRATAAAFEMTADHSSVEVDDQGSATCPKGGRCCHTFAILGNDEKWRAFSCSLKTRRFSIRRCWSSSRDLHQHAAGGPRQVCDQYLRPREGPERSEYPHRRRLTLVAWRTVVPASTCRSSRLNEGLHR